MSDVYKLLETHCYITRIPVHNDRSFCSLPIAKTKIAPKDVAYHLFQSLLWKTKVDANQTSINLCYCLKEAAFRLEILLASDSQF